MQNEVELTVIWLRVSVPVLSVASSVRDPFEAYKSAKLRNEQSRQHTECFYTL